MRIIQKLDRLPVLYAFTHVFLKNSSIHWMIWIIIQRISIVLNKNLNRFCLRRTRFRWIFPGVRKKPGMFCMFIIFALFIGASFWSQIFLLMASSHERVGAHRTTYLISLGTAPAPSGAVVRWGGDVMAGHATCSPRWVEHFYKCSASA